MKSLHFTIISVLALNMLISCSAQANKKQEDKQTSVKDNVEVFYFHYTRRCITCQAVQSVSKEAVTEMYGNKVSFTDYNLDKQDGKEKGKELGVSGQTLLIVSGNKKLDITNEGFMNARSNPEKLKEIIKSKIDPLLK